MTPSKIKLLRLYFYNGVRETIFKYYFMITQTQVGEVTLIGENLQRPDIHVWDRKNFHVRDLVLDTNEGTSNMFINRMSDFFWLALYNKSSDIRHISYFPSEIKRETIIKTFRLLAL